MATSKGHLLPPFTLFHTHIIIIIIIIIIARISRVPICHTRWEHRVLYNHTNNTHMHAHTHVGQGDRHGCEKQFRNNY